MRVTLSYRFLSAWTALLVRERSTHDCENVSCDPLFDVFVLWIHILTRNVLLSQRKLSLIRFLALLRQGCRASSVEPVQSLQSDYFHVNLGHKTAPNQNKNVTKTFDLLNFSLECRNSLGPLDPLAYPSILSRVLSHQTAKEGAERNVPIPM